MESNKNMDQQLKEALSRFTIPPSEKQKVLFMENATKMIVARKRKRFITFAFSILIGLTFITFFAVNTYNHNTLKNTLADNKTEISNTNTIEQETQQITEQTTKQIVEQTTLKTTQIEKNENSKVPNSLNQEKPIIVSKSDVPNRVAPIENAEPTPIAESSPKTELSTIPETTPIAEPATIPAPENLVVVEATPEPPKEEITKESSSEQNIQTPSTSPNEKSKLPKKSSSIFKNTLTEWESTMGIYYRPEMIFNIIENDKYIHNFGIEFTFHPFNPRYVIRTGIGLSISKGFYEYKVDYNEYLGSYNALDSVSFSLAENNFNLIPTYYFSSSDVYNENLSSYHTKLYRRFIYLQIPLELGYDFYKKGTFSMGVRTGPLLSLLINQQTTDLQLDPGKDKIVQINRITPERIAANWQYMAGFNFTKTLNHVILECEPRVAYYFNSVYEKGDQTKSPYSVNVRFAVGLK